MTSIQSLNAGGAVAVSCNLHNYKRDLDWKCEHCGELLREDESRPRTCLGALTKDLKIFGYHDTEYGDEGSVFPFHDLDEATKHSEKSGLEISDLTFWSREPTEDELELIKFGMQRALEFGP